MRLSSKLVYPVYILRGYRSIEYIHHRTYIDTDYGRYILDDKNKKGKFAIRRLQILADIKRRKLGGYEYCPIYRLNKAIHTEEQLIAHLVKCKRYVDNSGRLYNHAPTTFYKLTYHKVLRMAVIEGSHTIIWLKDINIPIKLKRPPIQGVIYAGLLRLPGRNILYEFTKTKKANTRRKL